MLTAFLIISLKKKLWFKLVFDLKKKEKLVVTYTSIGFGIIFRTPITQICLNLTLSLLFSKTACNKCALKMLDPNSNTPKNEANTNRIFKTGGGKIARLSL